MTNKYSEFSKNNKTVKKLENIFVPDQILDYHGLGILDQYDVEKLLNDFISEAFSINCNRVLVITGKGNLIRKLLPNLLKNIDTVKSFNKASSKNGGEGAYEIYLK